MPIITILVMQRSPAGHDAVGRPRAARPVAQSVARHHHLADDLAGGEIAHQALGAGVAEGASERAADLAGDAQRAALGVGDIDALDFVRSARLRLARQPQQPFARAVDRNLFGHHFRALQREVLGQGARSSFDTLVMASNGEAAEIDPVPELLHAHLALRFRHADRAQRVGELRARQADQRRLLRRDIALKRRLLDEGAPRPVSFRLCWSSDQVVMSARNIGAAGHMALRAYLHSSATLSSASAMPLSE